MTEIRSTLDMVMERAARLAAEVDEVQPDKDIEVLGMRLAATFLEGGEGNLLQILKEQKPETQMAVRRGMAKTLLRNITLPRDGTISDQSLLSLQSIVELSGNSSDINTICSELKQILDQYSSHREQVKQQFDGSIMQQLQAQMQQQGLTVTEDMNLVPTMHPQYDEEWSRVAADLNGQYNDALTQRKDLILQRFAA